MKFETLVLHNWCQFRHKEITFHPGLNAFLGPNGAGKSNALNAALFALTGDLARLPGNKAENICQLSDGGASGVRLVFTHQQLRLELSRGLKSMATRLVVRDLQSNTVLEDVRGDTKVSQRVLDVLRVRPEVLSSYVFVGQGDMFKPFDPSVRPAERAIAFQRLYGLERLEQLWEALGAYLVAMPVIAAPDVAPVEAELYDVDQQLAAVEQERQSLADIVGWSAQHDPDQHILNAAQLAAAMRPALASNTALHRGAVQHGWQTRTARRGLERQLAYMQSGEAALQQPAAAARTLLEQQAAGEARRQQHAKLRTELDNAEALLASRESLMPAESDGSLADIDMLQTQITELTRTLGIDRSDLTRLGNGNVCLSCGREFESAVLDRRASLTARIAADEQSLAGLQVHMRNARERQNLQHQAERELAALRGRHAHLTLMLREAGPPPNAVGPEQIAQARQTLADFDLVTQARQRLLGQLESSAAAYQQQRQTMRQARQAIRSAQAAVAAAPTEDAIQAAQQRLQQKFLRAQQLSAAGVRYEGLQQRRQAVVIRLQRTRDFAAQAEQSQLARRHTQALRDILHRDNLPKVLLHTRLDESRHATNTALEQFGANFRLESDPDELSYRAKFFDGRNQPVTRLSGGEEVITALGFRIAINARFANDLGLLCLDEPTVYLDVDNVRCLETALNRLRQLSQQRGLQCVLITHENVGHLFDHVTNF